MRHPPIDRLRTFARGQVDLTAHLLVEAHLALCSVCPDVVAQELNSQPELPEARGSGSAAALPPPFDRVWAAVAQASAPGRSREARVLPPGIRAAVPDSAGWDWNPAGPHGARSAFLVRDGETGSALFLSYYPRHTSYPRHLHLGLEENVILSGGYEDGRVHVDTADWVIEAPGSTHMPTTGPDEECWCLSRIEPPGIRFTDSEDAASTT